MRLTPGVKLAISMLRRSPKIPAGVYRNLESEPRLDPSAWAQGIGNEIRELSREWKLKVKHRPLLGGSWSLVLPCLCEGQQAVLKLSPDHRKLAAEAAALNAWAETGVSVRVLRSRPGALLTERITPGKSTPYITPYRAARLLARLGRAQAPDQSELWGFHEWMIERSLDRINRLAERSGFTEAPGWAMRLREDAEAEMRGLPQTVCHGDIYPDNLLSSPAGVRLIDPYGIRGPREIDVATLALNFTAPGDEFGSNLPELSDLTGCRLEAVEAIARFHALQSAVHHKAMYTPAAVHSEALVKFALS